MTRTELTSRRTSSPTTTPKSVDRSTETYLRSARAAARNSAITTDMRLRSESSLTETQAARNAGVLAADDDPIAAASVQRTSRSGVKGLRVTHRWDGVVKEVHEDFFIGSVHLRNDPETDVVADFAIDQVDDTEREFIAEGALFYVNSGYIPLGPGERIQASKVFFRRLPRWRQEDLDAMRDRARKRRAALGLDDEE